METNKQIRTVQTDILTHGRVYRCICTRKQSKHAYTQSRHKPSRQPDRVERCAPRTDAPPGRMPGRYAPRWYATERAPPAGLIPPLPLMICCKCSRRRRALPLRGNGCTRERTGRAQGPACMRRMRARPAWCCEAADDRCSEEMSHRACHPARRQARRPRAGRGPRGEKREGWWW